MHDFLRLLDAFFNNVSLGIRIIDAEAKLVAVNDAYCKLYGCSREELIGKEFTWVLRPEDRANALKIFKSQLEEEPGEAPPVHWKVRKKDGQYITVSVNSFNLHLEDGTIYRAAIVRDLSHIIRDQNDLEFHAAILKNVQDSVVVADVEGKILYWNHAAVAVYGRNEEEVLGQELYPYLPDGALEIVLNHFRQGNKTHDFHEWPYYSPGGEEKFLNLRITPLVDSMEMLIGLIVMSKDVSNQYRDKQQIKEQRNLLSSLVESQSNFLIRLNPAGRYTYSNKTFVRHGAYQENITGQSFLQHVYPEDRESWESDFKFLKSSRERKRLEFRMLTQKGEMFWAAWEFVVLLASDADLVIQAVGVDVSERKKTEQQRDHLLGEYQAINEELRASEEELRQNLEKTAELNQFIQHSEQRFRSLLENSFEAIILYDEPGFITYVSPNVREVLGYSAEEMLGSKGMTYIHGSDKDKTRGLLAKMMEKPGNKVYTLQRVRRKDDSYIWTEAYVTNLLHDRHVKGVVSNFRDVTERIDREEKLRSSEAFLNAAQHITKIGSVEFNLISGQVRHSTGVYSIYDYDLGENPKEAFSGVDYVHPDDVEKINKFFRTQEEFGPEWLQHVGNLPDEILQEIENGPFEYRIISAAGKLKYLRSHTRVVKDENGVPLKIVLTIQDITEEMYRERLLDETSQISGIGGWELDIGRSHIYWTEQIYRIFGLSPEEGLTLEKALSFYDPESQLVVSKAYESLLSHGIPFDLEAKMVSNSGKELWVRLIGQGERAHGKVVLAKGTMQDITDKKKQEKEVREYANRLRLATEAAGIGIWEWDLQRNKVNWDDRMLDIYGLRKTADQDNAQLSSEDWKACVHPEDVSALEASLQASMDSGKLEDEFRVLLPSGEVRWVKAYGKVFFDEAHKPLRSIGVNWDISKMKQIEEFLRRNNLELAKTNEELDHFVYSTSHNLRAPLTSIMGIVSLMKHYQNPEESYQYIDLIEKSVHKLDETILDITNYSRNTRVEIAREPVDFEALLRNTIESLSFLKEAGNIGISYELPEEMNFCSDASRLKMILTNLVSNAIKYANPNAVKPFIKILVREEKKGVLISVKDNGIGIAPEYHTKIFNMFFRATAHAQGSGLGLYIVKEAVEKLGGSIKVESKLGSGTNFMLRIPDLKA